MKVSMVSNNVSNNNSNVHFKGLIQGLGNAIIVQDDKISPKSIKLVKALDDYIERAWKAIRNGDLTLCSIPNKKNTVFIKPVYTQKEPSVLFEVDNGKFIERILINRKKPTNFRYEKTIDTEHGSATLKTYNSSVENDYDLNNHVNSIIEKTIPNVLPRRVYLEHFDAEAYKHYHDYP